MRDYKIVPPKQKYMNLPAIFASFGPRPVVAFNCTMENKAPMGGYVIAVQNLPEPAGG